MIGGLIMVVYFMLVFILGVWFVIIIIVCVLMGFLVLVIELFVIFYFWRLKVFILFVGLSRMLILVVSCDWVDWGLNRIMCVILIYLFLM